MSFLFYLVCKGQSRHETGDVGGGCYGFDPSDRIRKCTVTEPGTSYVLFSEYGCNGRIVAKGFGKRHFHPRVRFSSVMIKCPS